MYLDNVNNEQGVLRQGDVLRDVPILGAVDFKSVLYNEDGTPRGVVFEQPLKTDVAVLSHSCEIDPANGVKVTSIILAPLRDVHKATRPDKVQEIIDSNLINTDDAARGGTFSYLKYFYLEPHPLLAHKDGALVDFSKCFSVRNKSYQYLLDRKIIQLTNESRRFFNTKLGLYFSRS